jgi:hypothetical protein
MPWTNPVDPVVSTVITVAYAKSNILDPIRWLRLLTGNADPPASNYLVTSDSAGATSWKTGTAAIANVLGYQPVNRAGDTMSGDLVLQRASAPTTGALFLGNSGGVFIFDDGSQIQLFGLPVRIAQGLTVVGSVDGGSASAGNLALLGLHVGSLGMVNDGPYQGGSLTVGSIMNVIGLHTGISGITIDGGGIVNNGPYNGGSLTLGAIQTLFRGLSVGAQGIASAGQIAANNGLVASSITSNGQIASNVAPGGAAPITVLSTTNCPNLCANLLADQGGQGRYATSVPTGSAIPVADASGKLDAWITSTAAAPVPSNAVVGFDAPIASIPSGWTRFSVADGRILVGDGTTFSQTFLAGASYGSAWGHAHATSWASHQHPGGGLSVGGSTGGPSSTGTYGGTGSTAADGSHTHSGSSLTVGGTTTAAGGGGSSSDTWLPPMRGIFWIKKT